MDLILHDSLSEQKGAAKSTWTQIDVSYQKNTKKQTSSDLPKRLIAIHSSVASFAEVFANRAWTKCAPPNHKCNPRDTREVLQSETRRVQTPLSPPNDFARWRQGSKHSRESPARFSLRAKQGPAVVPAEQLFVKA